MRLPYDLLTGNYVKPRLFLCETNKDRICELETIELKGSFKFNAYSELTFTIGRTYTNMVTGETRVNPFYDKIEALRLVELEGFGYFEIQDPEITSDGIKELKNVTAYSLEYRLSQKYLENFKVNTGDTDSIEVMEADGSRIIPVTLINNVNKNLSLTDLVLEKVYDWSWGHIDSFLFPTTTGRQFDISRASIYDFIVQDMCEKFNCYAIFDTITNTINLYSETLVSKLIGDGVNNTFTIPPYQSIDTVSIDGYKTTAYSYSLIGDPQSGEKQKGRIVFEDTPGDGAKIEITDGDYEKWRTDVYVSFDNLAQEVNISYSAEDIKTVLTVKGQEDLDIREVNMGLPYIVDLSYYYTVDWMGQELFDAYTKYIKNSSAYQDEYTDYAEERLKLQNDISFLQNRVSLGYGVDSSVSSTTVGTYYVVTGGYYPNYEYKEKTLPADYNADDVYYKLNGVNVTEEKVHTLYSAIRKYLVEKNQEEEPDVKDVATKNKTWQKLLEELTEQFEFVQTDFGTLKSTLTREEKPATNDEVLGAFRTFLDIIWVELGLTPLQDLFLKPYEGIKSVNVDLGYSEPDSEHYWFYKPVEVMLDSLQDIIDARKKEIDALNEDLEEKTKLCNEITTKISIYNNFTHDQLVRLSPFLREDEYTDDNFVETDYDTIDDLIDVKRELLECGKIELAKLCEPKLEFSMDMANIYALKEFEPIIHQFQLGNMINVVVRPDYVKKARLLAVDINFDDFSDFSCEFGELTSLKTQSSIHADLLANAIAAGNSVASGQSYWDKGVDLATSTDIKIQSGLLSAIDGIYNADKSVLIDNHGILLRQVLDNGEYSPYQIWLTNNNILVSTDSFSTAQTGIGVFEVNGKELYGVLAKAVLAGYIEGSTIVGGTININDTFMVDMHGNVTMKAASIEGYVEENNVVSSINQSPEKIAINANKISLAGKQIDLTSDNITIDSTNFSVTKDGKITATSGEIAGWTIYPGLFRKETTVDGIDYQIYMQSTDGVSTSNAFVVRKKDSDATSWDYQFSVNYEGRLIAKNANITGTITANDGSIAGYNIGPGGSYDNALYKRVSNSSTDYEVGLKATNGDTDLAFYVKESSDNWDSSENNFFIRNNGYLYAQKADITGKITASSGSIGSWTIGDLDSYTDSIYTTYCAASSPSSSNPEYAVFMRGKGAATTIAIGVKKRTSSATDWTDADNPFYVRKDGYVKMTNANITGTVYSSSGTIGGFDLSSKYLRSDMTKSGTRYQTFLQAADGSDTTTAFAVRTSDDDGDTWTYQFRVNYDGSAVMRNATITGSSTIASACIPNLNATKITAGTLDVDRIPNISASKITSGTISTARLDASVITTGNFSSKTLSTGKLSVTSGGNIGIWTVNSNNYLYAISGNYGVSFSATSLSHGQGGSTTWVNIVKAGQNASDRRLKKNIIEFGDKLDRIFYNLKPVQFEYSKDFLGNGIHFGYIAQDVVKSIEDEGENVEDYSFIYETEIEDNSTEKYYQLNQTDFIALNTWQIQKLKNRIEELENRLEALERDDTK